MTASYDHSTGGVPSRFHYDLPQRTFHWSMAVMIFVAIALGIWASYLGRGSAIKDSLLLIHKSLGLTILILVIFRLPYRWFVGEPPYKQPLGKLTYTARSAVHMLIYGLMIFMPVSGYIFSGAAGRSLPFFGLFEWPSIVPKDKVMSQLGGSFHYWGAWVICIALTLHVSAVAWHRWIRRDDVLVRMLRPRLTPPCEPTKNSRKTLEGARHRQRTVFN
jgi:cytochrome b561